MKMKQHAEITYDKIDENKEYEEIINRVINECFENEHLENLKLSICVTLTVPEVIQIANKKYRNIDKATDVLSFPMFEREEIQELIKSNYPVDDVLGDLIISIPKVKEQAVEYGHSFERELAYMVVHGFYHLMGYDHMIEIDKIEMRAKEDEILNKLHITREN
jgi:probable rRNA maturation factor